MTNGPTKKKKKKPEPAGTGVRQEDVGFLPAPDPGKAFVLPRKEVRNLKAQGDVVETAPGELTRGRDLRATEREAQQQLKQLQQTAAPQLAEAGAFEQVTPQEVSLDPAAQPGGGIPVLGPSFSGIQGAISSLVQGTSFAGEKVVTGEQAFQPPLEGESIREAALREIKQNSFDEGISNSEAFGSVIEAIPIVGGAASKYASGLIQTPSANVRTVVSEIEKVKEAASTGQEKVRNGLEDPDFGLDRARDMEEDLAKLEGRIKLLINTSAQLRANTDEVNKIQEQILIAREKVARYRQASSFGLTAQMTQSGRTVPTDEQIFNELRRQQQTKDI